MKKYNWTFAYAEGHSLLLNDVFFNAFTEYRDIPGIVKTILYVNEEGYENCYISKEETQRIREQGKVFFNYEYRHKFQKHIAARANLFSSFWKKITATDLSAASDSQLLVLFDEYVENLTLMCAHYQVSGGRCFPVVEEFVKKKMADYVDSDKLAAAYSLVLTSTELDLLEREEIDLLKMTELEKITEDDLRRHAKNYAFQYLSSYDETMIFKSVRARIRDLHDKHGSANNYERELVAKKEQTKGRQQELMEKLAKDKELVDLIEFLRFQGKIRFDYKEWFFGAEYKFLVLLEEIARRIELPVREYLHSYRIEDTREFLRQKTEVPEEERKRRLQIFVLFQDGDERKFWSGDEAEKWGRKLLKKEAEQLTEFKGVVANPGQVTAKARVILPKSFEHIERVMGEFEDGEVLITTMTQPNLISIMKKASAIITNQGGITSHAAVLSREFGIPCIIGTYIATEAVNTGDEVEVDANEGVVRVVKRV